MSQDESFQVTWKPPSMYAILPALLPFQIPPLASIRRSVSAYSLRTLRRDTGFKSEDLDLNVENKELAAPAQAEEADTTRKYAIQGSHLLNAALAESQLQDPQSQALSRQLYLNGMTYLLQGLPSDLSEQERLHLRSALPKSLDRSPQVDESPHKPQTPSLLHRSVAAMIVVVCLLLRTALPYFKYFLAMAYSYERSHHVVENAFALSISSVDHFSGVGMGATRAALKAKSVVDIMTYCVEGICGGLNEGLGDGIRVINTSDTI